MIEENFPSAPVEVDIGCCCYTVFADSLKVSVLGAAREMGCGTRLFVCLFVFLVGKDYIIDFV